MPSVQTRAARSFKTTNATEKKIDRSEQTVATATQASTPDTQEDIKARARAYAFSGKTTGKSLPGRRYRTPPLRPSATAPPPSKSTEKPSRMSGATENDTSSTGARRKITPQPESAQTATVVVSAGAISEEDEYEQFVRSLGTSRWGDDMISLPSVASLLKFQDDEDDEFRLDDVDESDDEDEVAPTNGSPSTPDFDLAMSSAAQDWDISELEQELGSLLEEDFEAAVSTLLGSAPETNQTAPVAQLESSVAPNGKNKAAAKDTSPNTPLRDAARQASRTFVTVRQVGLLQQLMAQHNQLLLQQTVLSVRAVQSVKVEKERSRRTGGSVPEDSYNESPEDLVEIIDSAVGMLQDLDQNRKDAIRNLMQLDQGSSGATRPTGKRSLLSQLVAQTDEGGRRLTRSAFHLSLQDPNTIGSRNTLFDVQGLAGLKATFETVDQSYSTNRRTNGIDILAAPDHAEACRMVMKRAGTKFDQSMLPGVGDVSQVLSNVKEVFGTGFFPPATVEQQLQLRKNRNQFTAAEDNLILRGVNLYGEKQWLLIADRYLPDRSINTISQRYSKLCLMLYRAHGVVISDHGNLKPVPKDMKHETLDEDALSKLKKVDPPAVLNVHRWSIEEDLTLLKAVPLMGNMWAELSSRLIPHRDRGHLRKRYQVLERRIQATVKRTKRESETPSASVNRSGTKSGARSLPPPRSYAPSPKKQKLTASLGPRAVGQRHALSHSVAAYSRPPVRTSRPLPSLANGKSPGRKPMGLMARGSSHASRVSFPNSSSRMDSAADANSRAGLERILSETTNDWSQMSRMKRLMDNDAESAVASAAASHSGNGRRSADVEKLPSLEMDSASSSGLSMLGEASGVASASPSRTNGSIMASVFERAGKRPGGEQHISPGKDGSGHVASCNLESTPLQSQYSSARGVSTFGTPTPMGFSPAVKSMYSPAMHGGFSPGLGLKGFSPASMLGPVSSLGGIVGGESHDAFDLSNFAISERSKQALECNEELGRFKSAPLSSMSHPHTPLHAELLGETHGLKDSDLEAISALNSLSNSPARFLTKRASDHTSQDDEKKDAGDTKVSLFAAVIGGVEKKQDSTSGAKKRKAQS